MPARLRHQFPSEVLLTIIEARLDNDRPADALGIERDAPLAVACEEYSRVLGELERFREHPVFGPRAIAATGRLRAALIAFSRLRQSGMMRSR